MVEGCGKPAAEIATVLNALKAIDPNVPDQDRAAAAAALKVTRVIETHDLADDLDRAVGGLDAVADPDNAVTDRLRGWATTIRTRNRCQGEATDTIVHHFCTAGEGQGEAGQDEAIVDHFCTKGAGRGLLEAACGTGKTHIGIMAVEQMVDRMNLVEEGGVVLILEPSLKLVTQTAQRWVRHSRYRDKYDVIALCSDRKVIVRGDDDLEAATDSTRDEFQAEAPPEWKRVFPSADAIGGRTPEAYDKARVEEIHAFLTDFVDERPVKLVFATYHSASWLTKAYAWGKTHLPVQPIAVAVFDEAHTTAVTASQHLRDAAEGKRARASAAASGKKKKAGTKRTAVDFTLALHDKHVPIRHRLFMTATPKINAVRQEDDTTIGTDDAVSAAVDMRDVAVYGKPLYTEPDPDAEGQTIPRLGLRAAIDLGLVCDYKVKVCLSHRPRYWGYIYIYQCHSHCTPRSTGMAISHSSPNQHAAAMNESK